MSTFALEVTKNLLVKSELFTAEDVADLNLLNSTLFCYANGLIDREEMELILSQEEALELLPYCFDANDTGFYNYLVNTKEELISFVDMISEAA